MQMRLSYDGVVFEQVEVNPPALFGSSEEVNIAFTATAPGMHECYLIMSQAEALMLLQAIHNFFDEGDE